MNIINQLHNQLASTTISSSDELEIKSFIDNQIKARLEGKNPMYTIPSQTEVEHVIDYLVNRANKGRKLKLKKASYEQMVHKAEEWIEKLKKKADGIVETEQDVEVVKTWKSGMRLVKLVGENAYKREGKLMSHCVGSYFDSSNTNIYSLRDSKNEPHCTMEITKDNDYMQQIKGKGNGSIHPRYIEYVIDILKHFGIEVRGSELANLGYIELSEQLWKVFNYGYEGVRYLTFGGTNYFYSNSVLKKIKTDKQLTAYTKKVYGVKK